MTGVPFIARVVHATTPTSTGTVDVTTTTPMGTPKGAFILATRSSTLGTVAAGASICWGATDGTNNRSVMCFDRDNASTVTVAKTSGSRDKCLRLQDPTTGADAAVEAEFSAWINDGTNFGVRLNFTKVEGTGWNYVVVLFGGDDCECAVGDHQTNSAPATVNVGFETDFVLCHHMPTTDESNAQHMQWAPAVATRGGNGSGFLSAHESEGNVATSKSRRITENIKVARPSFYTVASLEDTAITAFLSNGFEVDNTFGPPETITLRIAYMAVKINGSGVCDVSEDDRESSPIESPAGPHGTVAYTWPAHQSEFLAFVFNSNTSASQNSGSGGMGVSDGITSGCVFVHSQHNQSTSNTGCMTDDKAMSCYNHSAASHLYEAEVDSQDTNGFTLDWTQAWTNARLFAGMSTELVSAYMGGSVAGVASTAAELEPTAVLAGTAAGTASTAAELEGTAAMAGTAAGVSAAAGNLGGTMPLQGTAVGAASTAADLKGTAELAGTAVGAASVDGNLEPTAALEGTAAGVAAATADLGGTAALEGTTAGVAAVTGALSLSGGSSIVACVELTGSKDAEADLTGSRDAEADLTGSRDAEADLAGSQDAEADLTGSRDAEADLSGSLESCS